MVGLVRESSIARRRLDCARLLKLPGPPARRGSAAPCPVLRAPDGIRVNAVAPAFERTRLVVGASAAADFRR